MKCLPREREPYPVSIAVAHIVFKEVAENHDMQAAGNNKPVAKCTRALCFTVVSLGPVKLCVTLTVSALVRTSSRSEMTVEPLTGSSGQAQLFSK